MLKQYAKTAIRRLSGRFGYAMKFPTYTPSTASRIIHAHDPIRFSTIALAVETIERENIPGSFAECGVYRGELSVFLRSVTDRKLYLFDTFQGFDSRDLDRSDCRFRDTDLASVMALVPDAIPRAGHFPETAAGLEQEPFAFVMLDFDLYRPTLAGLNFFYPRLSAGGYLFLHDYNSPESDHAISRAAHEFLVDKPESLIELPDMWGSALFRRIETTKS